MQGRSAEQRKLVWRKAYFGAFKEPISWIGIMNFFVISMLGRALIGQPGFILGAILGSIVMLQFHLRASRPHILKAREELGYGPPPATDSV